MSAIAITVSDLKNGVKLGTLDGHLDVVVSVAISKTGQRAVSGSWDQTLKVWDVETGGVLATFSGESAIFAVDLGSDGRTIVAGEQSGRIHFLRLVLPGDIVSPPGGEGPPAG